MDVQSVVQENWKSDTSLKWLNNYLLASQKERLCDSNVMTKLNKKGFPLGKPPPKKTSITLMRIRSVLPLPGPSAAYNLPEKFDQGILRANVQIYCRRFNSVMSHDFTQRSYAQAFFYAIDRKTVA